MRCKDEGWEQKQRDKTTGKIVPGPAYGGSDAGMKAVVAQIHAMGLKVGLCAPPARSPPLATHARPPRA